MQNVWTELGSQLGSWTAQGCANLTVCAAGARYGHRDIILGRFPTDYSAPLYPPPTHPPPRAHTPAPRAHTPARTRVAYSRSARLHQLLTGACDPEMAWPIRPSPRLPVSPSPRLPVSPSPRLQIPDGSADAGHRPCLRRLHPLRRRRRGRVKLHPDQ